MIITMTRRLEQSKALASDARQSILKWLAEPDANFSHQESGAPSDIGVCVTLITEKLQMAQPTVSRHLELLRRAEFVTAQKIGKWSFYKRSELEISAYKDWINEHI